MTRLRIAVGLLLVCAGAFSVAKKGLTLGDFSYAWPYLLLGFGILSTVVALAEPRSLVGPLLLVIGAGGWMAVGRLGFDVAAMWPFILLATGVTLAVGAGHTTSMQRIMALAWTVRPTARDEIPSRIKVVCVLGAVHLDLRDTKLSADAHMSLVVIVGYVRVLVPAHWPVVADDLPSLFFLSLDERGRRDNINTERSVPRLRLRSSGVAANVTVERW